VLILGETGTGKELVAQAIHRQSERRRKPFIALDCGAIPETLLESELFGHEKGSFTGADRRKPGQFQLADGGTCFLDEIGNLPLNLQAKLLRVLEAKQVQAVGAERASPMDIRFVAAPTRPAGACRGRFVSTGPLLRLAQYDSAAAVARAKEDIEYLTRRFLEEASVELRRPYRACSCRAGLLRQYDWPGTSASCGTWSGRRCCKPRAGDRRRPAAHGPEGHQHHCADRTRQADRKNAQGDR
jgi:transcriptional regulator with PAS, ATPase and Fis domain